MNTAQIKQLTERAQRISRLPATHETLKALREIESTIAAFSAGQPAKGALALTDDEAEVARLFKMTPEAVKSTTRGVSVLALMERQGGSR